ncbi:MAG: YHS domain-containing (seleno)protein [Saprospiraceae bacterium]
MKYLLFLSLLTTALFAACDAAPKGHTYLVNIDDQSIILDGYDPVAFFTDNKPVKGSADFTTNYHEATYQFASDEHKKMFVANPEKYAPQYGGYCGYAVSQGHLAPIHVEFFAILDGRLILQNNQRALDGWNGDPMSLQKADKYWPELLARSGKPFLPADEKKGLVNRNANDLVAEGYDVVSYVLENKAVKGEEKHVKPYNGGLYLFSSNEHKQMFSADPAKFAPLYGGYCSFAMSKGLLRPIDPMSFQIVDGHLLLQGSPEALAGFSQDITGNQAKADQNWLTLMAKYPEGKMGYDEAPTASK